MSKKLLRLKQDQLQMAVFKQLYLHVAKTEPNTESNRKT